MLFGFAPIVTLLVVGILIFVLLRKQALAAEASDRKRCATLVRHLSAIERLGDEVASRPPG